MAVAIVGNGIANFFDVLKRFTENLEGFDKIAGVVQPFIELTKLQFGDIIPVGITNIVADLKVLKAVKNASFCIFNADEVAKKPFAFKDFMSLGGLVNTAKRVFYIFASLFMLGEYLDRIQGVAASVGGFPWKTVLLLGAVVSSAFKGIIDLYENSATTAKLNLERQFFVKKDSELTPEQVTEKKTESDNITAEISKLQKSLESTFAKNPTSTLKETEQNIKKLEADLKLNKQIEGLRKVEDDAALKKIEDSLEKRKGLIPGLKAKGLLELVNAVAVNKFAEINKQRDMLKLLQNEKKRKLQNVLDDVNTLLAFDNKQYKAYKAEVFDVRQENLEMARSKTWQAIAYDISKAAVFSLILTKAPLLSLVPVDYLDVTKGGIELVGLISGLLGVRKFAFESYNKPKEEPRPILVA